MAFSCLLKKLIEVEIAKINSLMFWDIANICPLQILPILISQGLAIFVKTIGILIICLFRSYWNPQRQSFEPLPPSHGWKWVSVDGYRNSQYLSKSNFGRVQRTVITFFFSKMLSVFRGIWRWKHSTRLKTKLMYSSKTCTQSNYLRSLKGI